MEREKIEFLKEYLEQGGCCDLLKKYGISGGPGWSCTGCPIHRDGKCSSVSENHMIAKTLLAEFEAAEREREREREKKIEFCKKVIEKQGICQSALKGSGAGCHTGSCPLLRGDIPPACDGINASSALIAAQTLLAELEARPDSSEPGVKVTLHLKSSDLEIIDEGKTDIDVRAFCRYEDHLAVAGRLKEQNTELKIKLLWTESAAKSSDEQCVRLLTECRRKKADNKIMQSEARIRRIEIQRMTEENAKLRTEIDRILDMSQV